MWSSEIGTQACKIVHTATRHLSEKSSMNTGFRGVLPMYDIFGCASDFAHNFRHLMPTTLNCGATFTHSCPDKSGFRNLDIIRQYNSPFLSILIGVICCFLSSLDLRAARLVLPSVWLPRSVSSMHDSSKKHQPNTVSPFHPSRERSTPLQRDKLANR